MKKKVYNIINLAVFAFSALWFFRSFPDTLKDLRTVNAAYICALMLVALTAGLIKFFRLYFIFSARNKAPVYFAKQYCKTLSVSIIIPLKLGELFKIYCFGYGEDSYFYSLALILIDRFFDAMALMLLMLTISLFEPVKMSWLMTLLSLVVTLIIIAYILVPQICRSWKTNLLENPGNRNTESLLKLVQSIGSVNVLISKTLSGKGVIICIMSIAAWAAEIFGMMFIENTWGSGTSSAFLSDYFAAALGVGVSVSLRRFAACTIVLFVAAYLISRIIGKRSKKGV